MLLKTHIIAYALFLFLQSAASEGINCEGSIFCSGFSPNNALAKLAATINTLNTTSPPTYTNNEHIACLPGTSPTDEEVDNHGAYTEETVDVPGGICAYVQLTANGTTASEVKALVGKLQKHKCRYCGSVPTGTENNVSEGMLTINWSDDLKGCSGLC
ncbi:hypothetical protein MMC28_010841 [Mycoblastus sanguinarius]|nr:hypothetical protein [Mycoblastus sanguinarius]